MSFGRKNKHLSCQIMCINRQKDGIMCSWCGVGSCGHIWEDYCAAWVCVKVYIKTSRRCVPIPLPQWWCVVPGSPVWVVSVALNWFIKGLVASKNICGCVHQSDY